MIAFNLTGQNLIVFVDGRTFTIPRSDENFRKVYEAAENDDKATVLRYMDAKRVISEETEGRIAFDGYNLSFDGETIHNVITDKLHYLWKNGLPYNSLLRFMDRLMQNPSKRAVDELYRFLEACDLPITSDGHFLAYKRVRNDFTDCYTGTFDNSVGATPSLRRNQVDEDSDRTCSHGLHVCSAAYLPNFGLGGCSDRIVVVKVDPADVVAVPRDYHNSKMRVCAYEVIQDVSDKFYDSGNAEGILPRHFETEPDDEHDTDDELEDLIDGMGPMDDSSEDDDDDVSDLDEGFDNDEDDDIDDIDTPAPVAGPSSHATTSKLEERQVREIKRLLEGGKWPIVRIAEVFNVNESSIRKIRDGKTWSWVK